MAKYSCVVVAVFFAFTSSLTASAATHALGDASTSTFAQGNVSGATARGWEFQVNDDNVQVVQLGVNAWTDGTPLTLSLWNDNTPQTLLAQTSAVSSAGNWVFADLGSPVSLTPGKLYSVIAWANVTDAWYLFNNDPPAAFTPTGTIEFVQSMYGNDSDANTFPGNPIIFPEQYGVTDIGYIVPEPSTLALIALGGIIAFAVKRR